MTLSAVLRRAYLLAAVAVSALVLVNATQVMQRPPTFKNAPHNVSTEHKFKPHVIHKRATSQKVQAAYFTNWGIYGANFQPTDIDPTDLTHILYAFADVSPDTGTISLTDSWADEQKHYPGDSWNDVGNNLYGCLKQLYLLKLQNRNLKVLLSIGGWTYSQYGHFSFITDSTKRATFVTSAVSLIENYGFDGIDIDFEYPTTPALASGYASLLTSLRTAFDNLQAQKGDSTPYELTAAVPAGSDNYQYLNVPTMDKALTYWNLMAYDYAGSWLSWADNQANLYGGQRTNVSTDKAIRWYLANGATAGKINMGIPLYGRAFENTNGIGSSYSGGNDLIESGGIDDVLTLRQIGPGTIEAGVYSYKVLPIAGAQVYENLTDVTSYSYDSSKRELVSYDDPHIASVKAQYVRDNGLAGSMFWDLSTDKTGSDSLVSTTAQVYGTLDQTQNHINFPNSKWDNIRNNMGQSTGSSTTSSRSSTTSTTSTTSRGSTSTTSARTTSSTTSTRATTTTSTRASSTTTSSTRTSTTPTTTSRATTTSSQRSTTSTRRSTTTTSRSTSSVRSTSTTSRTSTSTSATPTGGSSSGACAGVAPWGSSTTYVGGNQATYNGHLWTAKWWSYNDTPGGPAGVWTDNGSC